MDPCRQSPRSPVRKWTAAEQLVAHRVAEQRLVGVMRVADHHGVAFVHDDAVDHACVVRRSGAAPATGLDLQCAVLVGQFEHPFRSLEQLAPEIGEQPERVHVDFEIVDDSGEILALRLRIELHLVTDHVVDGPVRQREGVQIGVVGDLDRRRSHAEAAGHLAAVSIHAGQQQSEQLTVREIVVDLQRHGALAGTHRAEVESQRRHAVREATGDQPSGESSDAPLSAAALVFVDHGRTVDPHDGFVAPHSNRPSTVDIDTSTDTRAALTRSNLRTGEGAGSSRARHGPRSSERTASMVSASPAALSSPVTA